ncbi:hypothetical protein FBEOM_5961 [Fusarium beomiforme]|uniref:Uncharacterized protein n=1 Tax=Fusarium beomiforme TaxID=44412 RepID=A0A9P5AJX2_9HYPO|nr:hypothetical protein FBEOM_5961 [Fusarium beomiforme]
MGQFNPSNTPTWTHYIPKQLIITKETLHDGLEWIYGKKADGTPNYGWEEEGDKSDSVQGRSKGLKGEVADYWTA